MEAIPRPPIQRLYSHDGFPRPTRIKVIRKSMKASPDQTESLLWGDCLFCTDAAMTDYDWVLVYDEFPRTPVGHHQE